MATGAPTDRNQPSARRPRRFSHDRLTTSQLVNAASEDSAVAPGFAERPTWARLLIVVGIVVAGLGVVPMFVPAGTLTRNGVQQSCGLPFIAMFPSDPYPQSDPYYAVSEACHHRSLDRQGILLCVVLAGGLVAGIAVATGKPNACFNPPPNWPTPPVGWTPPDKWWRPPADWPAPPAGWRFWVRNL